MGFERTKWVLKFRGQFGGLKLALVIGLVLLVSFACSLPWATPSPPEEPTVTPEGMTPEPTGLAITPTPTSPPPLLPPSLVESNPMPGVEISAIGSITLYFNQAMDRVSVENAIASQLSLSAELRWEDNATVRIIPEVPFSPASRIEFLLDENVLAANGLSLTEPQVLAYDVEGYLQLTGMLPEADASDVSPTTAIVAGFNRPVNPNEDLEDHFPAFWLQPEVGGRGEWINASTYIFYPEPALEGGTEYTVHIDPDLLSLSGAPLQEAYTWSFTTLPLQMVSIEPTPGARSVRLDSQVMVQFNQPMDMESVETNLILLDPDSRPVPGEFIWNEEFTQVSYKPRYFLKRDLTYSFLLTEGVRTLGGTRINAPVETNWRTSPALEVVGVEPSQNESIDVHEHLSVYFSAPIQPRNILQFVSLIPRVEGLKASLEDGGRTLHLSGNFTPDTHYSLIISPNLPDAWSGRLGVDFVLNFSTNPLEPKLFVTEQNDILFVTPQDSSLVVEATNLEQITYTLGSMPLDVFTQMLSTNDFSFLEVFVPESRTTLQQDLELPPNRREKIEIPLSPNDTPLSPGLYHVEFNQFSNQDPTRSFLVVVSNVNLTLKIGAKDAMVWAVDLRNFELISEAAVSIFTQDGELLASGLTDADGIFSVALDPLEDLSRVYYAILGLPGDDIFGLALSTWNQGLEGWNSLFSTDYQTPQTMVYIFSDRTIYQPGQTIFFRAVVRQVYNGRYTLLDVNEIPDGLISVSLYNQSGDEITVINLPISNFGTVNGSFSLPPGIEPGNYNLVIDDVSDASLEFQVVSGGIPGFDLAVNLSDEHILAGQRIQAVVKATHKSGAPAAAVPISWALYKESAKFDLPGYQIGILDTSWLNPQPDLLVDPFQAAILEGEGLTDNQGELVLEFPTAAEDGYFRFILTVMTQDESGLTQKASAEVFVNLTEYIIGVQPDSLIGQAGTPLGFDVKVVHLDQNPYGELPLRAEFQKVAWGRDEITAGETKAVPVLLPRFTLIGSTDFVTAPDGVARLSFTPDEPGVYQLDVVDYLSESPKTRTQTMIWVGGLGDAQWPDLLNNRLPLVSDKDYYLPGETAQVFVPNPFSEDAVALVTVERGVVLRHRVLDLEGAGTNLYLPLAGEDAPNVFVSVTLLGTSPQGRPDYRYGTLNLPVKPSEFSLNVELVDLPAMILPAEELTFGIQVTDSEGNPVVSELSLSIVDQSALEFGQVNTEAILERFYSTQPLGVLTGIPMSACTDCLDFTSVGVTSEDVDLSAMPVTLQNWSSAATVYWDADIVTNDQGEAEVVVLFPESLSSWHILLRGLTDDTRVGQVEAIIEATKELLLHPLTPRFLVMGDHTRLETLVHNNSQDEMIVDVNLEAIGIDLDDPASAQQRISIPAGGQAQVYWWGKPQDVESVELVFSARAEITTEGESVVLQDEARPMPGSIPVIRFLSSAAYSATGILESGEQHMDLISLPRSFEARNGVLRIELSTSLAAAMMTTLETLENSPSDFSEQIISQSLPNLDLFLALREIDLAAPGLQARLDRMLQAGIPQLLTHQNGDGGWGWWQGEQSDQFVSAYVLLGLSRARTVGAPIDGHVIDLAITYLQTTLPPTGRFSETWQLDRVAFIHYVLYQVGSEDPNAVADLYDLRELLNPGARALLALTLESLSPGDLRAEILRTELVSEAISSEYGLYWQDHTPSWRNLNSTLQTSAVVLYALAHYDLDADFLNDAIRFLMNHRDASGLWSSTFETAWVLKAQAEALKHLDEQAAAFGYSATLNDTPLASGAAADEMQLNPVVATRNLRDLHPDFPNSLVIQRNTGPGELYYSAQLLVERPIESVSALNNGFYLSRQFFPASCSDQTGSSRHNCAPITSAAAGDLVDVRLTLTVAEAAYFVVLQDYIPAGAEILTIQALSADPSDENDILFEEPWRTGWERWAFSEPRVYEDRITWAAQILQPGTYELTYRLALLYPGEYGVLPAQTWQNYTSEIPSNSSGDLFTIVTRN